MTYASLSQVKAALRLTDSVDDSMLTLALSSADEAINAYCGRTFGTAAADSTRTYAAGKPDAVEVDDLSSITTVEFSTDGVNWTTTTSYQAEPLNSFTDGLSWPTTRLRATTSTFSWPVNMGIQTVRVTGKFAFGSTPSSVTQAAVMQSSRFFARLSTPLGVTMGEFGAVRLLSRVDPDVEVLLQPYRRLRAAL